MRGDAGHRKGRATRSESSEKTQALSPLGRVGGRQQALEMSRIAPASPAPCFLPDATQGRSLWVIIIKIWYNLREGRESAEIEPGSGVLWRLRIEVRATHCSGSRLSCCDHLPFRGFCSRPGTERGWRGFEETRERGSVCFVFPVLVHACRRCAARTIHQGLAFRHRSSRLGSIERAERGNTWPRSPNGRGDRRRAGSNGGRYRS